MTSYKPDPLNLHFWGVPNVSYRGKALKFRSRKVLALLIYLVVGGKQYSREDLMALLWPESDSKRAGMSLRSTIARLRRTLAVAGEFIITEAGLVAFDFAQPFELDLHGVKEALKPEATPQAMKIALASIQGEFLQGFFLSDAPAFEQWATVQREAWQHHLETLYERLTRWQLTAGEGFSAVATALQWTAQAPLSEAAYRHLMGAHFLAGDRAAALQTYDRCLTMLSEELGVAPAADTTRLVERIRTTSPPRQLRETATAPRPLAELPIVGRTTEHSRLAALYHQTYQGMVQAAAIIGEAGLGKTRLATAFLTWASLATPAADVLQGRAFEVGGRLPYQPLVEALRTRLDAENAPEDLLADIWLAELSQLLPELLDRYPDLPPPITGEPDFVRARIFEAVARLVEALAARQPVILFVDDIQWADEGTLDMLHYLTRRWAEEQTRLLLLFTVRQEELVATSRLRDWLSNLGRDISLSRYRLSVLSTTTVQHLVNLLANGEMVVEAVDENIDTGQTPAQSFGTWLRTETGGVPFFIEAMLQMLLEQGILKQQPDGYFDIVAVWQQIQSKERIPLPPGVRDVILTRFQRLTQSASALLLAGAVLGRECGFERLCQVADVAELDGLPALEELLGRRLMLEVDSEARPYRFAHDNIRQVIYTEAGEARRRLYHRRALAGLERDKAPAAELAYHALALRLDERAFNYALLAGDDALTAHAPAEALIHYNRAHKIGQDAQIGSNLVCQLYHNRGRALELNHQYDDALANYQEMMALADERGDKTLKLAALTDQCIVRATQTPLYNPSEAKVLGHAALTLAREIDNRASEAKVLWGLLLIEMWSGGDNQQAHELGQQSLTIARELGLKEQIGFTLTDMVHNYLALGEMAAARQANLETGAIWKELKNIPMLADSYATGVWVHFLAGEYEAALQAGKEGVRLSQSISNHWGLAGALHSMGPPYLEQGDIGGAISKVEAGIRHATEAGMPAISLAALNHLIPAYLMAGSVERAAELADELYVKRDSIIPVFFLDSMAVVAQVKITQGDLKEAERVLNEADEQMSVDQSPNIRTGAIRRADAALQLALGKPDRALKIMQDLANWAVQAGVRHQLAETFWLAGKALLALGEEAQARQSFLKGQAVAEEIGERRILWKILWEMSQIETIAGHTNKAEQYHLQAREIITSIANQTGSDELKASFLARSNVQSVFDVSALSDR